MLLRAARDYTPPPQDRVNIRCRACQLQLCKSRIEKPHAGLKETDRDAVKDMAQFACDACGAVLEWSGDTARPGWSHLRQGGGRQSGGDTAGGDSRS